MKVGNASGQGRYHIQAEINMIPLIDVALVLLIIFMVISPILVKQQLNVELPKVAEGAVADEEAVKLQIDPQGRLSIEGEVIPVSNLKQGLLLHFPPNSKGALLIEADKDTAFDHVVNVMDTARQINIQKMGVAVLPR